MRNDDVTMDTAMTVRQVAPEEYDAWFALRIALWPDHTEEELRADQHAMASHPDSPVFMAWSNTDALAQAIGMIEMNIRAEAPGSDGAPVPYVEGWYVATDWRGKGVGKALIEAGEAWGRERGFTQIASDTIPLTYPASPAAHLALGFRIAAEYPAGVIEDEPSMHFIKDL